MTTPTIYRDLLLEHARHPKNSGRIDNPDLQAFAQNPLCGDELELTLTLSGEVIQDCKTQVRGCSICQASASMMGEILKGKTLESISSLTETFRGMMRGNNLSEKDIELFGELMALEGVREFPVRIKCALLAWSALDEGINNYKK